MSDNIKKIIGETFEEISQAIKNGEFGKKRKIGLTILGSEHGVENMIKGAELAYSNDGSFDIVLIGKKMDTIFELIAVETETECHKKMEQLLDSGYLSACVTMHYNFPIGVSTVGNAITPGNGREMLIATTTGTTSSNRIEAMIKNAINGIIVSKSLGNKNPNIGILNLDGARTVLNALTKLKENGYNINLSESIRSDGGSIMRGNDLLCGNVDVMVTDSLTGNILMKVFSSFTSGGNYEASGYGYGPGIGNDYDKLILILSRASGIPVVANALIFANRLSKGNVLSISIDEYKKAKQANLDGIISSILDATNKINEKIKMPDKEVVTEEIIGIDVMELDNAVNFLWKNNIYATSGMGCTGPIILVNDKNLVKALKVLKENKMITE